MLRHAVMPRRGPDRMYTPSTARPQGDRIVERSISSDIPIYVSGEDAGTGQRAADRPPVQYPSPVNAAWRCSGAALGIPPLRRVHPRVTRSACSLPPPSGADQLSGWRLPANPIEAIATGLFENCSRQGQKPAYCRYPTGTQVARPLGMEAQGGTFVSLVPARGA